MIEFHSLVRAVQIRAVQIRAVPIGAQLLSGTRFALRGIGVLLGACWPQAVLVR